VVAPPEVTDKNSVLPIACAPLLSKFTAWTLRYGRAVHSAHVFNELGLVARL
jgi:hypothetical protein